MKVHILNGNELDETIKVDALVGAINTAGNWLPPVKEVTDVQGDYFQSKLSIYHNPLVRTNSVRDGMVEVMFGNPRLPKVEFTDMLFVVDNLRLPMSKLIENILDKAKILGHKTLAIPIFRGVMSDKIREMVTEIKKGFRFSVKAKYEMEVWLMVYYNPDLYKALCKRMRDMDCQDK